MEAGGMDLPILCLMRERGIDGLIDQMHEYMDRCKMGVAGGKTPLYQQSLQTNNISENKTQQHRFLPNATKNY